MWLKGGYPIIFASNVFHNSHLIQKCIQNQQQLLILYTFPNQMIGWGHFIYFLPTVHKPSLWKLQNCFIAPSIKDALHLPWHLLLSFFSFLASQTVEVMYEVDEDDSGGVACTGCPDLLCCFLNLDLTWQKNPKMSKSHNSKSSLKQNSTCSLQSDLNFKKASPETL